MRETAETHLLYCCYLKAPLHRGLLRYELKEFRHQFQYHNMGHHRS